MKHRHLQGINSETQNKVHGANDATEGCRREKNTRGRGMACAEPQTQWYVQNSTHKKGWDYETSLAVQWLRFCLPMQGVQVQPFSQGAKIPHASWPKKQNIKQKQYCNKFKKTLKMVHVKKVLKTKRGWDLWIQYSWKEGRWELRAWMEMQEKLGNWVFTWKDPISI